MELTPHLKRKIKAHVEGNLYRINAGSADCYAFSLYKNKKGKIDWEGGWDWKDSLVMERYEWLYLLKERKFIKRS